MGLITSKLRRTKKTIEILERLEIEMNSIERDRQSIEETHKRVKNRIKVFAIFLYLSSLVLFFYLYMFYYADWLSLLCVSPLIILACVLMNLRSCISRYYIWCLNKSSMKLKEMREEKKKLLEDIMDNETYTVAKPILDKYGIPERNTKANPYTQEFDVHNNETSTTEYTQTSAMTRSSTEISV